MSLGGGDDVDRRGNIAQPLLTAASGNDHFAFGAFLTRRLGHAPPMPPLPRRSPAARAAIPAGFLVTGNETKFRIVDKSELSFHQRSAKSLAPSDELRAKSFEKDQGARRWITHGPVVNPRPAVDGAWHSAPWRLGREIKRYTLSPPQPSCQLFRSRKLNWFARPPHRAAVPPVVSKPSRVRHLSCGRNFDRTAAKCCRP